MQEKLTLVGRSGVEELDHLQTRPGYMHSFHYCIHTPVGISDKTWFGCTNFSVSSFDEAKKSAKDLLKKEQIVYN
ncbi:hypothetical protein TNCT_245031 [Trichonephila clavata]|uniref:Uncharacterized protein n=1 Tax=Trichonephila clavata TaxID=2740835 RepID=A0A8X6K9Z4_TRICU|nr:hypothetical protein TNCT_245031 [Trichonephila clavata]